MAEAARVSLISATTTFAPSSRNRSAYASPMPWPAPVMIATLSSSRPMSGTPLVPVYLRAVNEVEALGDRRFAALLVTPHGLGHEERHGAALALLLVQVDDTPLADQHVTDNDRPVVVELLLTVEHETALGEQLPHDLVHRVLAAGRVFGLVLGEAPPELHCKRPRRRGRDTREPGGLRGGGVVVDGVVVLERVGEVRDRPALDGHAVCTGRLPDDAAVECHPSLSIPPARVRALFDGRVNHRDTVTPTSVFNAGRRTRKWGCWTARSRSSPARATASDGVRPSSWPTRVRRSS